MLEKNDLCEISSFLTFGIFLIFDQVLKLIWLDWQSWYDNFMAEQAARTQGFKEDDRNKGGNFYFLLGT